MFQGASNLVNSHKFKIEIFTMIVPFLVLAGSFPVHLSMDAIPEPHFTLNATAIQTGVSLGSATPYVNVNQA